jgi:acyl-CoA thioester hydrolase
MSLKKINAHKNILKVRYSEIDAQSIVYNSHYLTYLDISLAELMDNIYDQDTYIKETGNDFHTVNVNMSYLAPAKLNDQLEVYSAIKNIGNASITFIQEIYKKNTDELLNKSEIVWVNTNQETHLSNNIPDELKQKFVKYLINQK